MLKELMERLGESSHKEEVYTFVRLAPTIMMPERLELRRSKRNPRLRVPETPSPSNKSRNQHCPCGSGLKFKKCCNK